MILLAGCASTRSPHPIRVAQGKPVDELTYTPVEVLEEELRKQGLEEADLAVEKSMLPKGGRLYLLEKTYNSADPILFAVVSDGRASFKCEDSEVTNTYLQPTGATPGTLALAAIGARYDKTRTEIRCDIQARMDLPFQIRLVNARQDTVSVYQVGGD